MSIPADAPRKFQQLDSDVTELYIKLDQIQETQRDHGSRLGTIETKVKGLNTKVDRVNGSVIRLTTRLDTLDVSMSDIDTKVTEVDTKVTELDTKVTELDQRLSGRLDHIVELLEQRETAPGT